MRIHELKIWPEYFKEVKRGTKTFEFRRNDRSFKVGDEVYLREFKPDAQEYTGLIIRCRITYILEHTRGMEEGFCAFSFKVMQHILSTFKQP